LPCPARLVDRRVPVSMKCKTDKSGRHKDGSGHHHPVGVFPVEEQLEQFGHLPSLVISPLPSARARPAANCQTFVVRPTQSRAYERGRRLLFRCDTIASRSRLYSRLIPPRLAVDRLPRASTLGLPRSLAFRFQPELDQAATAAEPVTHREPTAAVSHGMDPLVQSHSALMRGFLVIERLGYGPDNPPPHTVVKTSTSHH
jgi:hypothetical protein